MKCFFRKYPRSLLFPCILLICVVALLTACNGSILTPCGQQHTLPDFVRTRLYTGEILTYYSTSGDSVCWELEYLFKGEISVSQNGTGMSSCRAYYEVENLRFCPDVCSDVEAANLWHPLCERGNKKTVHKQMDTYFVKASDKSLDDPRLKWEGEWEAVLSDHVEYKSTLNLNGRLYYHVYVFDPPDSTYYQAIYYNHSKGFVGWITDDGEVWYLHSF